MSVVKTNPWIVEYIRDTGIRNKECGGGEIYASRWGEMFEKNIRNISLAGRQTSVYDRRQRMARQFNEFEGTDPQHRSK
jgi:hypothetical protein